MRISNFCLILSTVLGFSCSHVGVLPENEKPKTITSDIFPEVISRSEYYREMAYGFSLDNQMKKAIEYYRLSLLHDPKNTKARIQLADAYRKVKVEHLASSELSEVLKLEPNNKVALQKIADLYLTTRIYSKAREAYLEVLRFQAEDEKALWALYFISKVEKKYNDALNLLARIEKANPEEFESLFYVASEKASIYRLQKNWELELKYLISAYDLKPNLYAHVSSLSDSYFRFKKYKEAQNILERFTDTNDFNLEISEKLAYAALQNQNYDITLREYAKQRPFSHDTYYIDQKVAHIQFLMRDYKSAEKMYTQLTKQRPEDDESTYFLSKVYQLDNRLEESSRLLKRLPISSNYYGEAQVELADQEKKNNQFNSAINRLRDAHMKRPDLASIYKAYADMLIENTRFVEAIALIEQGLGLHPKDEELRLRIAFVHYRLNNQKSFKRHMTMAIKLNPNNSRIYATLAELWYIKGKKPADIEFFVRQAMELKSNNKNLKPLLAWAMMEQNKSVESIALFEEYYEMDPNDHFYVKTLAQIYRRGNVSGKAESFGKIAQALEADLNLKTKLLDDVRKKATLLDEEDASKSRLPASLEHY